MWMNDLKMAVEVNDPKTVSCTHAMPRLLTTINK